MNLYLLYKNSVIHLHDDQYQSKKSAWKKDLVNHIKNLNGNRLHYILPIKSYATWNFYISVEGWKFQDKL